jgi:hypothetical protein
MTHHTKLTNKSIRLVLEDVPRVHFYEGGPRCPEDIILPSSMRAILEFLGEKDYGCKHCLTQNPDCKIFCTYAFLVGVTGAASFLSWKEGWHGDNVAIFYMSDDPGAPERHAFEAIGYGYESLEKRPGRDNASLFRQRIIESIQKGIPVLAYGVIGPPEPCIITGYDENGDILIGWNFFQKDPQFGAGLEFEPSGYFRKRAWFKDTHSLLIIGDKPEKPPLKEVYREALKWALQVARTPMVKPDPTAPEWYQNRHNGLAAYTAWAEHLLRDEDFPAGNEAVLRQRYEVHESAVGTVAEARWYGSQFLIEAANPDFHPPLSLAENIYHAAACYAGEHDLMWKLWHLAGGIGNPEAYRKLADPAIRRQMVPIILQARDKDAEAAKYIELTLADWK